MNFLVIITVLILFVSFFTALSVSYLIGCLEEKKVWMRWTIHFLEAIKSDKPWPDPPSEMPPDSDIRAIFWALRRIFRFKR